MRPIDADELIEFINDRISDGSENPASKYTIIQDETLMEIGSKVKSMPIVPQFGQWISVKDRLPNTNGEYLVFRPNFGERGTISICYFDGQNTWHDNDRVDFSRILKPEDASYWMPLPEQPKEDGHEKVVCIN